MFSEHFKKRTGIIALIEETRTAINSHFYASETKTDQSNPSGEYWFKKKILFPLYPCWFRCIFVKDQDFIMFILFCYYSCCFKCCFVAKAKWLDFQSKTKVYASVLLVFLRIWEFLLWESSIEQSIDRLLHNNCNDIHLSRTLTTDILS